MQQNHPIRFALIGHGRIGKRHAALINQNPLARLVAVCDCLSAEEAGHQDDHIPFFQSMETLLDETRPDVVNICLPNHLHREATLLALKKGSHVVCEKPLAIRKEDAEEMLHQSLLTGKKIFVVMQNRYSPPAQWLNDLLTENRLGKIFMVQVNCFWNRDDRYYTGNDWHGRKDEDGGTLFTQFSHFIDMLYWLFGDITNIRANLRDFNHQHSTDFEDSGTVTFDLQKGGIGTLSFSTAVWNSNLESSLTIIGEHGSVKVAGQYMNEVTHCHINGYTMPELAPSAPPNNYGAWQGSASNHAHVIQNVIDNLSANHPITTNAFEGLKVVEIIEQIYRKDE